MVSPTRKTRVVRRGGVVDTTRTVGQTSITRCCNISVGQTLLSRQAPARGFVVSGLCNGLTDDSDDGLPFPYPAFRCPRGGSTGLLVGLVIRLMVGGAAHLGGCTNPALSCHSRWRGIAPALTHLWTAIRETPKAFATAVCVPYFLSNWLGVIVGLE